MFNAPTPPSYLYGIGSRVYDLHWEFSLPNACTLFTKYFKRQLSGSFDMLPH